MCLMVWVEDVRFAVRGVMPGVRILRIETLIGADVHVQPAIPVEIRGHRAEGVHVDPIESDLGAHLGEVRLAVVSVEVEGLAVRNPVPFPAHVSTEEVGIAIAVVVEEERARDPARFQEAGTLRGIVERAVSAAQVEEVARPDRGEDVEPAILVHVGNCGAPPVEIGILRSAEALRPVIHPGRGRHVREDRGRATGDHHFLGGKAT